MMRVWPLVLESAAMVLLWAAIVVMSMLTALCHAFSHHMYFIAFGAGLGLLHFILNVWLVSLLRGKTNCCLLVLLALTQTTPLFLLCRRAWRSLRAGCDRNPVTKKHKSLRAKYALCNETSSSLTQLAEVTEEHSRVSCVPSQRESTVPPEEPDSLEASPTPGDIESGSTSEPLRVTTTKFLPNTKKIQLSFGGPDEIYGGERKLYKFVARRVQALYAEEKRLSYHIVVKSSSQAIVHASRSDLCAEELPDRVLNKDPPTLCNDVHYIANFIKGLGYQTIGVTKRDASEELKFVQGDLNKLVWLLVWPCTVLMIYSAISRRGFARGEEGIAYTSPGLGVLVWLVTQRAVDDPWRNTLILIPLRLLFTVSRTILVCAIGSTWLSMAVFAYISAKVTGLLAICAYITYSKVVKNIELYADPTERYTYNAMYEPIVQIPESLVYCCWAVWWHTTTPLINEPTKLGILLMALISQVSGLTWLWFMRAFLKEPLQDPVQVLQMVKDREFSRT